MKIISSFKDYYDYVAYLHGGGDPKIVYARHVIDWPYDEPRELRDHNIPPPMGRTVNGQTYVREYAALVVCGQPLLIERQATELLLRGYESKSIQAEEFGWRMSERVLESDGYLRRWGLMDNDWFEQRNQQMKAAYRKLAISSVGDPVFLVHRYDHTNVLVQTKVPKLGDITGFVARHPPEQIYQRIAYFLGNEIWDNPDGMPVPKVTDAEMAAAKGFDPKRAFRPKMR